MLLYKLSIVEPLIDFLLVNVVVLSETRVKNNDLLFYYFTCIFVVIRVVIPLCGGNIDTTILGRCLDRGLAADGRLVKFTVTVSDRPGGIAELAGFLCKLGVSIKDMMHERAWIKNDIFSVEVFIQCMPTFCPTTVLFLLSCVSF